MAIAPPKFKPKGFKTPKQQKADSDRKRPSATRRGYGRGWRQLRETIMARDGFRCVECSKPVVLHKREGVGRAEVAHVDHEDGNSHNRAEDNLRTLCASCHNTRTARDQAFGRAAPGWMRHG